MLWSPEELKVKCEVFQAKWTSFVQTAAFDEFVEFAVAASSITGYLVTKGLPGLHQSAYAIEQKLLPHFDPWQTPTMDVDTLEALHGLMETFNERVASFIQGNFSELVERRKHADVGNPENMALAKSVWFVTHNPEQWEGLTSQAQYFNVQAGVCSLESCLASQYEPAIVLVDALGGKPGAFEFAIKALLGCFSATHLIGVNLAPDFESLNNALVAGCDFCFTASTAQPLIMDRIVKLCESEKEAPYRVLVVDDSKTASAAVQHTLSESGIESMAITEPHEVLKSLGAFQPDLILMDMYMPGCTGVEVTRVVRQHVEYLSIPVVYLSGDTNVALQVDALRLGGEHFLTKPFNPVILNAVVHSKIERYRALRRSMFHDSLTDLLNHTAAKQRLDAALVRAAATQQPLCVAMMDIDHFKKVNDTYGHPMGDQVIRSMAWLLKQRMRDTDVIGRYGGEEFLVVLPGSNATESIALLNAIREDFAQIGYQHQDVRFTCTFSAGVALWSPGLSAEALIARADEALYLSKRSGRNQIRTGAPVRRANKAEVKSASST